MVSPWLLLFCSPLSFKIDSKGRMRFSFYIALVVSLLVGLGPLSLQAQTDGGSLTLTAGTLSTIQPGEGTLTLSGGNIYSGTATLNFYGVLIQSYTGTLILSGSQATQDLTLASTGDLTISGTISPGVTVMAAGTLQLNSPTNTGSEETPPSSTQGVITAGGINFISGSTVNPGIVFYGGIGLGGTGTLTVTVLDVFDAASTPQTLTVMAAPEPTSNVLIALGLSMMLLSRCRGKKRSVV